MDRPVLSLCLIARDEEERLGRCLSAAAPLVDEIVVADTGSTDRTREIAAAHGARVVDVPWRDDFAAARNACLGEATGAWILVLDADETLQRPDRGALAARLGDPAALAYTVELVSDHGDGRVETAHLARLFRNRQDLRYEGRVHEQILPALCRALGRETWLPPRSGLLATHDGYRPEVRAARGKLERNLRLLRAENAARPDDPGPRFFLARELTPRAGGDALDMPEAREALVVLRPAAEALAAAPARGLTDPLLALAAELALACGDEAAARRWLDALAAALGETRRWCFAAGSLALARSAGAEAGGSAAREALALFERVARAPEGSDALPADPRLGGAWGAARAAAAGRRAGDEAIAAEHRARLAAAPRDPGAATELRLIDAWAERRAGRVGPALEQLGAAVKADPGDPRAWWGLGCLMAEAGQPDAGARMALTALRAAPGWAAAASLARGETAPPPSGLLALWTALR